MFQHNRKLVALERERIELERERTDIERKRGEERLKCDDKERERKEYDERAHIRSLAFFNTLGRGGH